jgi:manganese/zinc/iron transport system substrate-binding protein
MLKKYLMFIVVGLLLLGGCSTKSNSVLKEDGKIMVTTTTSQVADAVKNIGGEKVIVKSLMGPGTDPHLYKASQGDIAKLQDADMIFYNGLHLEGKMLNIFEKIGEKKPTVAIADRIKEKDLLKDNQNGSIDPHIWFDIDLWTEAVTSIEEELSKFDPENKDLYQQNAKLYLSKLAELKKFAFEKIAEIPDHQRVLVTAHDAFGYFGRAYDIEVLGLQGLSTDAEYGLGDVKLLVDLLVERNIKAVFIESSISERSINAVMEGAQKQGQIVEIGGQLYSDAMGEAGTEEGTYIGMYKHNIDTIVNALK